MALLGSSLAQKYHEKNEATSYQANKKEQPLSKQGFLRSVQDGAKMTHVRGDLDK